MQLQRNEVPDSYFYNLWEDYVEYRETSVEIDLSITPASRQEQLEQYEYLWWLLEEEQTNEFYFI